MKSQQSGLFEHEQRWRGVMGAGVGDTCVVYATVNRADVLAKTLQTLQRQTVAPCAVILSCAKATDAPADVDAGTSVLLGEPGLTRQRNHALRNLPPEASYVAFFDDDFIPHPRWIEMVEAVFREKPDVAVITGQVLADGIKGPGISFDDGLAIVERCKDLPPPGDLVAGYSPYGCNMAFRRSAIEGLQFDERLVLYGWQEDRDFGAQAARHGKAVKAMAAAGVHMGVKSGRVSGVRLGYSQVANPVYLHRKGTMTTRDMADHMVRNIGSNLVKSLRPEPFVDRAGRLRGNLLALADVLRGKINPERVLSL